MTEKEKQQAGLLYMPGSGQLLEEFVRARALTRLFNATTEEQQDYRRQLIRGLFGDIGEGFFVEPPFRCDYGVNIFVGRHFFCNFDCTMIDSARITIGDNVFFGPKVNLYTAGHPIDAAVRNTWLEYGKPITIGSDVWIGGNVVVNPGVSIGSNVIIGSGAVVTRDIPDNTIAAGNPCRVLRPITEEDTRLWRQYQKEYMATASETTNIEELLKER